MNNFFNPGNLLFYFLAWAVFTFWGIGASSLLGVAEGQGLAGGATILMWGIIIGVTALATAFAMAYKLKQHQIVLFNKILFFLFIASSAFVIYRVSSDNKTVGKDIVQHAANELKFITTAAHSQLNSKGAEMPMGIGMAAPNYFENDVIYFYGNLNYEKSVTDHSPYDSLVFKKTELGIEIAYAPPWFVPIHLKMDYGILLLRTLSVAYDFHEVIVNETNGQTAYIDRSKCSMEYWPEYLLQINSIEAISRENNPIREKALDHAGLVNIEYAFLKPLEVKGQWVRVILMTDGMKELGKGWIKWTENNRMLITYSLLS